MTAQELIRMAQAEIGTKESPANSNNVKYNTWYYGREVSGDAYPWCCVFMSWLFKGTNLIKKSASCMYLGQWFKDQKRWYSEPQVGDLVFFRFNNSTRWTNHVGIVSKVNISTIETIEGNTSADNKGSQSNGGMVAKRTRKRNSSIIGYGRPRYAVDPVTVKLDDNQITEIALQVIDGKWGTGEIRKSRLRAEGYDYVVIQRRVNEILSK